MTQTVSRTVTGNTPSQPPPGLLELLDSDLFDWDNPRHREAYLRSWVSSALPKPEMPDE